MPNITGLVILNSAAFGFLILLAMFLALKKNKEKDHYNVKLKGGYLNITSNYGTIGLGLNGEQAYYQHGNVKKDISRDVELELKTVKEIVGKGIEASVNEKNILFKGEEGLKKWFEVMGTAKPHMKDMLEGYSNAAEKNAPKPPHMRMRRQKRVPMLGEKYDE